MASPGSGKPLEDLHPIASCRPTNGFIKSVEAKADRGSRRGGAADGEARCSNGERVLDIRFRTPAKAMLLCTSWSGHTASAQYSTPAKPALITLAEVTGSPRNAVQATQNNHQGLQDGCCFCLGSSRPLKHQAPRWRGQNHMLKATFDSIGRITLFGAKALRDAWFPPFEME